MVDGPEHPYPPGTLVKLPGVFLTTRGFHQTWGMKRPEFIYSDPNHVSFDMGAWMGKSERTDGRVMGMVLSSLDASILTSIPEAYKNEERFTVYLVQVGEHPPGWFCWSEVLLLKEEDAHCLVDLPR